MLQLKRLWRRRKRVDSLKIKRRRRKTTKSCLKHKIRRISRMEDLIRIRLKILANQLILKN